jgi:hypothetical protein
MTINTESKVTHISKELYEFARDEATAPSDLPEGAYEQIVNGYIDVLEEHDPSMWDRVIDQPPSNSLLAYALETAHVMVKWRRLHNSDSQCCLCGGDIEMDPIGTFRMSHNPDPVATEGRCCGACNEFVVLPARMSAWA